MQAIVIAIAESLLCVNTDSDNDESMHTYRILEPDQAHMECADPHLRGIPPCSTASMSPHITSRSAVTVPDITPPLRLPRRPAGHGSSRNATSTPASHLSCGECGRRCTSPLCPRDEHWGMCKSRVHLVQQTTSQLSASSGSRHVVPCGRSGDLGDAGGLSRGVPLRGTPEPTFERCTHCIAAPPTHQAKQGVAGGTRPALHMMSALPRR